MQIKGEKDRIQQIFKIAALDLKIKLALLSVLINSDEKIAISCGLFFISELLVQSESMR